MRCCAIPCSCPSPCPAPLGAPTAAGTSARQEQPPVSIGTRSNLERAALYLLSPAAAMVVRSSQPVLQQLSALLVETTSIILPPQSQVRSLQTGIATAPKARAMIGGKILLKNKNSSLSCSHRLVMGTVPPCWEPPPRALSASAAPAHSGGAKNGSWKKILRCCLGARPETWSDGDSHGTKT